MSIYFKEFIEENNKVFCFHEAMGVSKNVLRFPITNEMANTLTFLPGRALRASALNWFCTEGLMEASKNREKLLQLVNQQLNSAIPFQKSSVPEAPAKKVVGEMARSVHNLYGNEHDSKTLISQDLFSPEARQRLPILNQVRIDGLTIDEYYEKFLEPKRMNLVGDKPIVINLVELRNACEAYGLKPFKYGGVDGYIQYCEKGDYLKSHEKRSVNPNNQQGFDLRPEKKFNKETQTWEDVDDAVSTDRSGRTVVNFQGGSASFDPTRASGVISQMHGRFNQLAKSIEENKPLDDVDPKQVEVWKQLINTSKQLKKMEVGWKDKGAGKGKVASKFGFPDYNHLGSQQAPPPSTIDPQLLLKKIRDGLSQRRETKLKFWQNPEAFGPKVDDPSQPNAPDGWYWTDGTNLIFKLNKQQIDGIIQYIVEPYEETGMWNVLWPNKNVDALKSAGPTNAGSTNRMDIGNLFNAGVKGNEEDMQGVKMVLHSLEGIKHKNFIYNQEYIKVPISTFDSVKDENGNPTSEPADPVLAKLRKEGGLKWELKTPQQKKDGHPLAALFRQDPNAPTTAFLVGQGGVRYKVAYDAETGKWNIFIPSGKLGKGFSPASHGAVGNAALASGPDISYNGGDKGGHIEGNVASEKVFNQLINRMIAGEQGGLEPGGPYKSLVDTESIKKGINIAKSNFEGQKASQGLKVYDIFSKDQINSWAVEGLKNVSGDIGFTIGYITDAEWKNFLGVKGRKGRKWDASDELSKELSQSGKGRGIHAIMHKNKALIDDVDEEDSEAYQQELDKAINRRQQIIDWAAENRHKATNGIVLDLIADKLKTEPEVVKSFAHNGFEFRARSVGKYVLNRMNEEFLKMKKDGVVSLQAIGGKNDDGSQRSYDVASDGNKGIRSGEWEGQHKVLTPERAAKLLGYDYDQEDPQVTYSGNNKVSKPEILPFGQIKPKNKIDEPLDPHSFFNIPSKTQPSAQKLEPLDPHSFFNIPPKTQPSAQKLGPLDPRGFFNSKKIGESRFYDFKTWSEMVGTGAVFGGEKPKDGCGWNWWGTPGHPMGISAKGEVNVKKDSKNGQRKKSSK